MKAEHKGKQRDKASVKVKSKHSKTLKEKEADEERAEKTKYKNKEEATYLLGEFEKTAEISTFYGFMPIKTPEITTEDFSTAVLFKESVGYAKKDSAVTDTFSPQLEERIALLRTYLAHNMPALPHPVMLYYKKHTANKQGKKNTHEHFGLDIIGTPSSVAEALMIRATLSVLEEEGFTDIYIDINSIGDRESIARFERELASYYRKNINSIPAPFRELFKKDVFEIMRCADEGLQQLKESAPQSMNFLSETSRQHFTEVLEYLEVLNIPYKINNSLVGNKHYCSQTLFEIHQNGNSVGKDQSSLLAIGSRHNHLAKKIGFKKDAPLISVSVRYPKQKDTAESVRIHKLQTPRFYFIQLGFRAKLKSLEIIEMLRKAHIPLYHSITKDKLVGQLAAAENLRLPYVIIMGQKEALDNTVVIRNMFSREQETVTLAELVHYLKKLK